MNAADPMMKGCLQINVPSQPFGASWAEPCRDTKSTATPPIGAPVGVIFEGSDPIHPV